MRKIKLTELVKHDTICKLEMEKDMFESFKDFKPGTQGCEKCKNFLYIEHFDYMLTEMCVPKSLWFFGIEYNEKTKVLKIPKNFDPTFAREVIKIYIQSWEEEEKDKFILLNAAPLKVFNKAMKYFDLTEDANHSTDAGFTYSGLYMDNIFEFLEMEYTINPWN